MPKLGTVVINNLVKRTIHHVMYCHMSVGSQYIVLCCAHASCVDGRCDAYRRK